MSSLNASDKLLDYYSRLEHAMNNNKVKKIEGSVFLRLNKVTQAKRAAVLKEASMTEEELGDESDRYLRKKWIRRSPHELHEFVFTAIGVYQMEKFHRYLDELKLIESIDKDKFTLDPSPSAIMMKDDQIALLALVATRSFSEKCAMDFSVTSEKVRIEAWYDVFCNCVEFLVKYNIIAPRKEEINKREPMARQGVGGLMTGANKLARCTNLYKSGGRRYWLELELGDDEKSWSKGALENSKISLASLFELILAGNSPEIELVQNLKGFCSDVAYESIHKVVSSSPYGDIKIEELIEESIDHLVFGS